MSTLYEITGQYLELYEMMESADELEMKVIEDTLDGMDGELEEKAENYAIIMAELDADAKTDEKPTVFHRKNNCGWLVTMRFEDFMELYGDSR